MHRIITQAKKKGFKLRTDHGASEAVLQSIDVTLHHYYGVVGKALSWGVLTAFAMKDYVQILRGWSDLTPAEEYKSAIDIGGSQINQFFMFCEGANL